MKTNYFKLIEKYFNQQMDEKERADFEDQLMENDSLRAEYDEYKEIYEAIGDKEIIELRRSLKKIGEKYKGDEDGNHGSGQIVNGWFWIAALLIISISIISVTYMLVNSSLTKQVLGFNIGSEIIRDRIYRLEPAYAEIIRYRVRSEDFHLESPRDSVVVERRSEIVFSWNTSIKETIFLDVLNKYGKVIFTTGVTGKNRYIFSKKIPQGIFVFRFRTLSDTIYTGLFYVV